jgi:1-acyl-sn-glycerol-3-phosphate acyltransferase
VTEGNHTADKHTQDTYRRLYKTRPWRIGWTRIATTLLLSPFLISLALSRTVFFILFNSLFLLMPPDWRRLFTRSGLPYQIVIFLSCGVIYRTNFPLGGGCVDHGREREATRRELIVFNHHGVCDIFLFYIFNQIGASGLVVSYPVYYYCKMQQWVFLFDHAFLPIHRQNVRQIIRAAQRTSLLLFPEGAGKKGHGVLRFNPALYKLYSRVQPYSVRIDYALPFYDYYGLDLPLYKIACYVCIAINPWTIFTIESLPPINYTRDEWKSATEESRSAIAQSANEPLIDLMFDQRDYDRYVTDTEVSRERGRCD